MLKISEPPVLRDATVPSEDYRNVSLHRRFELNCPISGHPRPKIVWFKVCPCDTEVLTSGFEICGDYVQCIGRMWSQEPQIFRYFIVTLNEHS